MERPGLQERFLNAIRRQKIPSTFFLVNGFRISGILQAFDSFTMAVRCGEKQELIFKHAVSTIIPDIPVELAEQT